jgi:hypothetical protein
VLTYAKKVVDDDDVLRAQATIDLRAGRLPADVAGIGTRDQYWLKLAVAYQAAWLVDQPDAFDRIEVTEAGGSTNKTIFTDSSLELAPFAKSALRRVSWLKSRSLHVRAGDERNFSRYDDNHLPGYNHYEPL